MKRMVHIVGNLAPGGMGSFLMNLYHSIDREQLQFDFIVMGEKPINYHKEAEKLGARIYRIPGLSRNPIGYFNGIKSIIKQNQYEAVFRHTDIATVAIDLIAARMGGAKRRIPHSHSTDAKHLWVHKILRPLLVQNSTQLFACSEPAGRWMYGNKKFEIVKNGISLQTYAFQEDVRREKRKELGIKDGQLVIGHVGNFVYAKNHPFLLEIFREVVNRVSDAQLLLAGDGELREQIEKKTEELGLQENVRLLGMRQDVPELLQAMDIYLFPSVYEGLPMALVEAQASGLTCFISDTIAKEILLTDYIYARSLKLTPEKWAEEILQHWGTRKAGDVEALRKAGYDIRQTAEFYQNL